MGLSSKNSKSFPKNLLSPDGDTEDLPSEKNDIQGSCYALHLKSCLETSMDIGSFVHHRKLHILS
jgi:hypothetical protein